MFQALNPNSGLSATCVQLANSCDSDISGLNINGLDGITFVSEICEITCGCDGVYPSKAPVVLTLEPSSTPVTSTTRDPFSKLYTISLMINSIMLIENKKFHGKNQGLTDKFLQKIGNPKSKIEMFLKTQIRLISWKKYLSEAINSWRYVETFNAKCETPEPFFQHCGYFSRSQMDKRVGAFESRMSQLSQN